MPRFAANLTMMFNEVPFLDRFKAASEAGFTAVEFLFPYEHSPEEVAAKAKAAGVQIVLFNMPAGNWACGRARHHRSFREESRNFVTAWTRRCCMPSILGVSRLHAMAGIAPAGADPAACRATLIANLKYAAQKLAAREITLLLEAINTRDMPGFLVSTQKDSHSICEAVGAAEPQDANGSLSHAGDGGRSGHEPQAICVAVRAHSDCWMPRAARAGHRRGPLRVSVSCN